MPYLDPTEVKNAITLGAVWRPGDKLFYGGTLYTLVSDGIAWNLSTDPASMATGVERYKITKQTIQRIAAGTVLEDFRLSAAGFWQLAPGVVALQVGYASLQDP